jgi:hypothetical protein
MVEKISGRTGRGETHSVELLRSEAQRLKRWESFAWDDFSYLSAGIERAGSSGLQRGNGEEEGAEVFGHFDGSIEDEEPVLSVVVLIEVEL